MPVGLWGAAVSARRKLATVLTNDDGIAKIAVR